MSIDVHLKDLYPIKKLDKLIIPEHHTIHDGSKISEFEANIHLVGTERTPKTN